MCLSILCINAGCGLVVRQHTIGEGCQDFFDCHDQSVTPPALRKEPRSRQDLAHADRGEAQLFGRLGEPSEHSRIGSRPQRLRKNVRVENYHERSISRGAERGGKTRGSPRNSAIASTQAAAKSPPATAALRMARASASIDRLCAAARRLSRRCTSASRLRTVIAATRSSSNRPDMLSMLAQLGALPLLWSPWISATPGHLRGTCAPTNHPDP